MNINSINAGNNLQAVYQKNTKPADKGAEIAAAAEKKPNLDKVDLSAAALPKVELPKRLSSDQVREIKAQTMESYSNMVTQMFNGQVDAADKNSKSFMANLKSILASATSQKTESSSPSSPTSPSSFDDDPVWGVDAMATKLMDMAMSLSGGDSAKFDTLRDAVEKGFKAAGADLGGKLPSVSQNTYKEVMKRFDYLKENGNLDNYKYTKA
ncbi:MAG: hypothetical protein RSA20_08355 [Oscillospiraceae bacterium]